MIPTASPSPKQAPVRSKPELAYERAMIEVFGDLAEIFGNPRSHGELYAVIFVSAQPLIMEEIAKRADVCMGATSTGLRALENLGAIQRKVEGRTGTYSACCELKTLVAGFINQRLLPKLKKSNSTLRKASTLVPALPPDLAADASWKLQRVSQWHTRAEHFVPVAEKILQSALKFLPADGGK